MRISFKRNGFIALASMLSFAVYAGDNLPLATAASGTNGSIQVSEHGVDTSNEIQQARVIQGTVLEEGTNEPLIGVNVVVKGTTIGTTTDVEGKYSIRIPSDNAVLVFSYIGQKTEEYSVKGLKSLDVIMKSDATMLSEVVVYTGYMTQKKADLTGSVALADSKDIKKTSANVMKAMQGKMAGVKISNNGGNPAEDIGIQIRGLSSLSGAVTPLIVLDGMPAEALLECYRLTSNKEYLDYGQRTLDELLMTQASWQPPYMYVNVLGGFGVLNADGEWNDSRESLFSELIIQYGKLLGKPEYIERGYAALKASFVMMYCTENPQTKQQWEKVHPFFASEDYGFMMENYGHGGRTNPAGEGMGEFTIYDWGNGAAAEAYNRILDKFGKIE